MTVTSLTILHCIRAPVGGAFRHVVDLARSQAAAGHRVGILCDSSTGGAYGAEQIDTLTPDLALGVIRTPMERRISPRDLAVTLGLGRRVAALRPDVLHGHGAKGGAYARIIGSALRLAGQRPARIYSPHGGSMHMDPRTAKGRLVFGTERLLERLSDAIVFVSAFELATYTAKVGAPSVPHRLIYNGVAPREFEPVAPAPDAADLLFIGELRHLKGVDVAIDAIDRHRRDQRLVRLVIVGDGPDAARFRARVEELGLSDRISFRPPMPIRAALALARAVVLPSRAESLPYVVLETIAAGVPILATRVGGIAEVFGAGADALLPPADVAALADAIGRLLDAPDAARHDATALRDAIAGRFSIATMASANEALYHEILTRRPAPHAASPHPEEVQSR
jgi:glycosyltransferase involved in cell wall biosynthesis